MLVRDRMTRYLITVAPDDSVSKAYTLMRESRVQRLPVVSGSRLVGIITCRDIWERMPVRALFLDDRDAGRLLERISVGGLMTLNPTTATPETPLADAARLMVDRRIGALPVLDGDELVGLVTRSDVLGGLITILGGVPPGPPAAR